MTEPLKVLFIAGAGRSGSTIVDNVLGQVPGWFSAGEVQYVWDRGARDNRLCGCGEPFHDCPTWKRVWAEAFGATSVDVEALVALRERLTPRRVAFARATRQPSQALTDYVDHLGRLLRAIAATTSNSVVVDSSKSPGHLHALTQVEDIDLYVLHLIRDPRAVAFSWLKKKVYDPSGEPLLMTRHTPRRSAMLWLSWNVAIELMASRRSLPYKQWQYEDYVTSPLAMTVDVVQWLGGSNLAVESLPFVEENVVRLSTGHALAGNPVRFTTGDVALQLDDEWARSLRRKDRLLIDVLTWPFLLRYGYRLPVGDSRRSIRSLAS